MEQKVKVTYLDFGAIRAKIFCIFGWYNIANDLSTNGIQEQSVLKIEVIVDALEANTEDLTT